MQSLSLDEAFLDLTGTARLFGPARGVAEALRRAVREETQLTVSVGVAPVKMVAKIASDLAKPDGLLEIEPADVAGFLAPLPVRRIWGVGPVAEERLRSAGFETIGDLARADPRALSARFGPWGVALARLGQGRDFSEVEPYRDAVSYSEENTFADDVSSPEILEAALITHAESVAQRLRRDRLRARTVVLKLKLARRVAPGPRGYPLLTRRTTLREPSDDGALLAHAATELLARAALSEPVRLLGVGVTQLISSDTGQLALFSTRDARRERLNRALDAIAGRFGSGAIVRGDARPAARAGLSLQHKRGTDPGDR